MQHTFRFHSDSTGGKIGRLISGEMEGGRFHIKMRIDGEEGEFMVPFEIRVATAWDADRPIVKQERKWWDFLGRWKDRKNKKKKKRGQSGGLKVY